MKRVAGIIMEGVNQYLHRSRDSWAYCQDIFIQRDANHLIVELGASLDVLFALIVIGVLTAPSTLLQGAYAFVAAFVGYWAVKFWTTP